MIRKLCSLLIALAVISPIASAQNDPTAEDIELARYLYRGSSAEIFASRIHKSITSVIEGMQRRGGAEMKRYAQPLGNVSETLRKAFTSERIHAGTIENLAQIIADDPEHIQEVLKWLRNPLALRFQELRRASPDIDSANNFFSAIDAESDETEQRLYLMADNLMKDGSGAHLLEVMKRLAYTTLTLYGNEAPELKPFIAEPLESFGEKESEFQRALHSRVIGNHLYTYRALTDMELMEYGNFFDSDAGRWYAGAITRSTVAAYAAIMEELRIEYYDD